MGPVSPRRIIIHGVLASAEVALLARDKGRLGLPVRLSMRALIIPRMKPRADEASNSVEISRPSKIIHFYVKA